MPPLVAQPVLIMSLAALKASPPLHRYVFADSTGRIEVELDDDRDWSFIRKDQPITIFGKVDRDRHSISIDVKDARPAQ